MNKKSVITVATLLVILSGGYLIYRTKFWIKGVKTKEEAISVIVNSGKSQNVGNSLDKMGEGYLIAWGNAALKNQKEFSFEGRKFSTLGGTAIKK